MNYEQYHALFDEVLNAEHPNPPYDKPSYFDYTKLNKARMKRWDKHLQLSDALKQQLKNISAPQQWIIITEPWCGDASHIVPFLVEMTKQNDLLSYDIVLRDSPPFLIEQYLTNGSKGIPKLVVRDANGNDLFTWGPRPAGAQEVVMRNKAENGDLEALKIALQHWYNEDKGKEVCSEIGELLKAVKS
jgi:hypothetical protein